MALCLGFDPLYTTVEGTVPVLGICILLSVKIKLVFGVVTLLVTGTHCL